MATQIWLDYFQLLEKIADTLAEVSEMQKGKKVAVDKGDLDKLDGMMKQEQVFTMTLRGYEQKRLKALSALGVPPGRVSDLEKFMPAAVKTQGKRTVAKLQQNFKQYVTASTATKETLEYHLNMIETRTGMVGDYVPPSKNPRQSRSLEKEGLGTTNATVRPGNVGLNWRQFQKEKVDAPKIVPVSQAQLTQGQKELESPSVAPTVGGNYATGGAMSDLRLFAQQEERNRLSQVRQQSFKDNADTNK